MSRELLFSQDYLEDMGISIAIIVVCLLIRKLFTKYIFHILLKLSKRARTNLFTNVWLAYEKPIQWLLIIIGVYIAVDYNAYLDQTNTLFLNIMRSWVIFLISWGLYNLSSATSVLFARMNEKYDLGIDDILIPFLSKALRVFIVAVAISVIAQEFGYEFGGFVAGLGLGGLAISLAAKDALANMFGGIVIITEKPFALGDWILTPSVEGTVEEISFRSTKVRTFANAVVTVPNATLANEPITNWSKMKKRRVTFNLSVSYDTPKEKLEIIVKQINDLLKNHPDIHQETIFVTFDQYQENGLTIFLYYFTKTTVWGEYLKVKENINFSIMEMIENEGIHIAIPSRKLYTDPEAGKSRHSTSPSN